jgi:adenylate cyclase
MDRVDGDEIAKLLREREARSLMLLLGVTLAGFSILAVYFTVRVVAEPQAEFPVRAMTLYFGGSILFGAVLLLLLQQPRWILAVGVATALSGATFPATVSLIMWRAFAPEAPAALLTKVPIATAGIAMIAIMTLTLRPLHVVIAGSGVAVTLLAYFGLAAQDPATVFAAHSALPYMGPAVSPSRLFMELVLVAVATAGAASATFFARRTIREAVTLQRATEQLSRYFSPDIASRIRDGGEAFLRPGGREQEVVVLFSDLAGFTRTCAGLPASEALAILSEYHERMVAEIFRAGGTLDKFIGDGIMATFGTPQPADDAADRALGAARGMIAAVAELNRERAARGQAPLVQRIGIHAGAAMVGNVGTRQRLEFTVIGDTVNVAKRIETACKSIGRTALLSAAVVQQLTDTAALEPIGPVGLDGQPQPIELYALA